MLTKYASTSAAEATKSPSAKVRPCGLAAEAAVVGVEDNVVFVVGIEMVV
jgi:hypothetical protein